MEHHFPHHAEKHSYHGDGYYGQPRSAQVGHVTGGVQQMSLDPPGNATNYVPQTTPGVYPHIGGGANNQGPPSHAANLGALPPSSTLAPRTHVPATNYQGTGGSRPCYSSSSSAVRPSRPAPTQTSLPSNPPGAHLTRLPPPPLMGTTYQPSLTTPPPLSSSGSMNYPSMQGQQDTIPQPSTLSRSDPPTGKISASLVGNAMPGVCGAATGPPVRDISNALRGSYSGPPMHGPPVKSMTGTTAPPTTMLTGTPAGGMSVPPTRGMSGPPTGGMSGPPTGGISGPPTGGMSCPPTGGMSGPPTRGMSGPPTGRMSGPPTGGMSYPPTGGMSGPPTGGMSGPPTGGMSGPPTGGMSGPSTGGMSGPPTGGMSYPPTGGMSGPPTGGMSGPPTGGMSGPPTGGMSGPPTGGMSGPPTGGMSGPPTGGMSGPPTGGMSGPPTGGMSGPPTGGMSGPPTGGMSGPPTGGMSGPPTGGMSGPPTGGMSGPPTGGMSGPPTGGMSGPPTGGMSGPPTGGMSGPPTGGMSGPPTGGISGPPSRGMYGPPTGTISGPLVSGPPTGTTMGLPTGELAVGPINRFTTTVNSTLPASSATAPPTTATPTTATPTTATLKHFTSYPVPAPGHHQLSRYPATPGKALGGGPRLVTGVAPVGGDRGSGEGSEKSWSPQLMPAGMSAPPPQQPAQQSTADPLLQPINILEQRNILPSKMPLPPPIVLPNNQGKFAPDHRVFCSTLNAVPITNSLLNKLKLPLAIHLHPYKDMTEKDCPVVHPSVIIRCRSCRAYINPYVAIIDTRHWRCNMCFRPNSLPEDFDCDDYSGIRGDQHHRVELRKSSVEYIAPSEYMVRPPQPCVYYFVLDVSFKSVDSGVLSIFCRTLLEHLDELPGDARTLVGILTFDSALHFYSFTSTLSEPQMMVVSDVEDVFLPTPDSLLVNLKEYKEMFRALLEDLPRIFAKNQSDKTALGSALQAASKLLPTLNMAPASDFYKSLALDCNSQQICIDLFAFSGQFMDLSTISCAAKFSSGHTFYYPDFHHAKKPARIRFQKDLQRYLTRKIGFEAVMRIRCTEGVSLHTFHGNFFVRSTDLLSLPSVNPDLGYTINISIDENLKDVGAVCFQAALLYTSSEGQRRIRVHSLSLPVSSDLAHIYARANVQTIAVTLANMAVDRAISSSLGDAREALMNTVVDNGKMYRTNMGSSRQASQYVLPASLSLLPLFVVALLKSTAFSLSSKISYDRRVQMMNLIKCMPLDYLLCVVYPRLYDTQMLSTNDIVRTGDDSEELSLPLLQLSAEKLNRCGVYLMDYGLGLYLWVSKDATSEYLSEVLGVPHFGAIPEIMMELPPLENEKSQLLRKFVHQIRSSRQHFLPLQVIREDGPHRLLFIENLVDDRTELGTSYYELLSHIARQQTK